MESGWPIVLIVLIKTEDRNEFNIFRQIISGFCGLPRSKPWFPLQKKKNKKKQQWIAQCQSSANLLIIHMGDLSRRQWNYLEMVTDSYIWNATLFWPNVYYSTVRLQLKKVSLILWT
jgi:hypothetical protein